MRESRTDDAIAVGLAILVHVLLFGLILLGALWSASSRPTSAAGSPVSADVIDPNALSAADRRALASRPEPVAEPVPEPAPEPVPAPTPEPVVEPLPEPEPEPVAAPPQPLPEPRPEDAVERRQPAPQEVVPKPDTVSQDAVRREAQAAEAREREQEEKRRQAQIELAEQQKQQEAEEKRRLARQELEKLRAEREKAQREASLAEQRLKQIADREARQAAERAAASAASSAASPPPGRPDGDSGLAAKYAAAIQEAVRRNWRRPDNIQLGQRCRLYITQLPGGEVISVEFDPSCPYDAQGRRSVEAAVRAAEPLPYAGFESVFNRRLNFNFTAQD
ncbi:cell envelope integrity protein TolA [Luteimonas sp. S4-F44]|uniref:cell envelope integrity protein TolA n=1 Tax=Luteimonas sp. S4-F44 TaxID=2925842 RepID=UPI001F530414|nr:cell envelope integrity protein TolA [Luteimonas sp. S4-F44]UNK41803.1 cell envelope integrity protein TolA [Luteimonas sp. S4-F44]